MPTTRHDCRNCGGAGYTIDAPTCPACGGEGTTEPQPLRRSALAHPKETP